MARLKKIKEELQLLSTQASSKENSAQKSQTKRNKIKALDIKEEPVQINNTAENKAETTKNPDKPLSNIELYVQNVITQIKQAELAENFEKAIKLHGTRKVSLRVDLDVFELYNNQIIKYSPAMTKALHIVHIVMGAVKAKKLKF